MTIEHTNYKQSDYSMLYKARMQQKRNVLYLGRSLTRDRKLIANTAPPICSACIKALILGLMLYRLNLGSKIKYTLAQGREGTLGRTMLATSARIKRAIVQSLC